MGTLAVFLETQTPVPVVLEQRTRTVVVCSVINRTILPVVYLETIQLHQTPVVAYLETLRHQHRLVDYLEITLISPQREEGYLEILTILLETITRTRVGEECLVILVVLERQTIHQAFSEIQIRAQIT